MNYRLIPIKLKKPLVNLDKALGQIRNAVNDVTNTGEKDFEGTTNTWSNKPTFFVVAAKGVDPIEGTTGTDNLIYLWVNSGTSQHPIDPVNAPYLVFKSGYIAKTRPNKLESGQGGFTGGTVFSKHVEHPGNKARNFDKKIAKKLEKELPAKVQQAINRSIG